MPEREKLFSITKKDLRIDTFRAGGKGGQHQNKTDSAARITHLESGAVGESREHRHQYQNKKEAWKRLREDPRFVAWFKKRCAEALLGAEDRDRREREIDVAVDRAMEPSNITTEVNDERGRWVEVDEDLLS